MKPEPRLSDLSRRRDIREMSRDSADWHRADAKRRAVRRTTPERTALDRVLAPVKWIAVAVAIAGESVSRLWRDR